MKKLVIFALFISTCTFGQSFTITPSNPNHILEIKKSGIGINHHNSDNSVGIGTFVDNSGAWIQTHTNHPLRFRTNGGATQMILATNGNLGIGDIIPTQKLYVDGTATVTGTTDSDGLVTGSSLAIGNGDVINKFLKVYLTAQNIGAVSANGCITQAYNVTGVNADDTVLLNIEVPFSTLYVAGVMAAEGQVNVKYCNNSNTATIGQNNMVMRFTVIK